MSKGLKNYERPELSVNKMAFIGCRLELIKFRRGTAIGVVGREDVEVTTRGMDFSTCLRHDTV